MSNTSKNGYLHAVNYKRSGVSDKHKDLLDFDIPGWRVATNDARWFANLDECERLYQSLERVPLDSESNWLLRQKVKNNHGKLSAERISLLNERIPGWNELLIKSFSDRLEECVRQASSLGRLPKPSENRWLSAQKGKYKRGKLPQEYVRQLDENLPGWRVTRRSLFLENLSECEVLYKSLGRLPKTSENAWLHQIRAINAAGKLSADHVSILNERLPGWDAKLQKSFSEQLETCVEQVSSLGRLPKYSENTWLRNQKRKYKLGKLSQDQINQLDEALPGWRDAFQ